MMQYASKALEIVEWFHNEVREILMVMGKVRGQMEGYNRALINAYLKALLTMMEELIGTNSSLYMEEDGLRETCRHILCEGTKEEMPYRIMYSFYNEALAYIRENPISYEDIETKVQVYYILLMHGYMENFLEGYARLVMDPSRSDAGKKVAKLRERMRGIEEDDMPSLRSIEAGILEAAFTVSGRGSTCVRNAVMNFIRALLHEDSQTGKRVYEIFIEEI